MELPKDRLQESGAYLFKDNGVDVFASATAYTCSEDVAYRRADGQPVSQETRDTIRKAFWPDKSQMVFKTTWDEMIRGVERQTRMVFLFTN